MPLVCVPAFLLVQPPLKASSVLTPTLGVWNLLLLQAVPTSGLSTVSHKHNLDDHLFLKNLWLLNPHAPTTTKNNHTPVSANSESQSNGLIMSFWSYLLLLASRNANRTPSPPCLPTFSCLSVRSAQDHVVIVLCLWHLSFSVLGSAQMTSWWRLFQPLDKYLQHSAMYVSLLDICLSS